jgi:sporulation protein YlmC with PRC-barrel domain
MANISGSSSTGTTGSVAANETERLIASDKVEGTAVYNRSGERLGSVHNFMVDKLSGHVSYAVLSFGGFLGMGEKYYPLPWDALDYDTSMGGYVVDINKERLENAPSYAADESPWSEPNYGKRVQDFYGYRH